MADERIPPARVLVVTATYDEAANLERLVEALYALRVDGLQVLVVDDQSPDGTAALARRLRARWPGLRLIERSGPRGRGLAGKDGFLYALHDPAIERVVEMDADFSHQPQDVPRLLNAIQDADMAIGSRRVRGGADERSMARRWLDRQAALYARRLLRLPVEDANSNFRAYTRKALEAIDPATLESVGSSLVLEVLYRASRAGLKIVETPVDFLGRKAGASKFSLARLAFSCFWILRLRYPALKRI